MARVLRFAFVALGIALFAAVLYGTDLGQVGVSLSRVGVAGAASVLAVYACAFGLDTAVWMATFVMRRPALGFLARLYEIRIIGEAVNNSTPLGSVGGEPVKAMMLRRYAGIGLREGVSTLVLAKTCMLMGLVVFLALGFALMLTFDQLAAPMPQIAGTGLAVFAVCILLLVLAQHFGLAGRAGAWVKRGRHGERLRRWLEAIAELDRQLRGFYVRHLHRMFQALALSFANWLLGAGELLVTLYFLDSPVSVTDAIVVESMAQLVRAGTFFIPLSLGAQEGAFMLVLGAMTGTSALGLAVALVRRGRELVWISLGLFLFWIVSGRTLHPDAPENA